MAKKSKKATRKNYSGSKISDMQAIQMGDEGKSVLGRWACSLPKNQIDHFNIDWEFHDTAINRWVQGEGGTKSVPPDSYAAGRYMDEFQLPTTVTVNQVRYKVQAIAKKRDVDKKYYDKNGKKQTKKVSLAYWTAKETKWCLYNFNEQNRPAQPSAPEAKMNESGTAITVKWDGFERPTTCMVLYRYHDNEIAPNKWDKVAPVDKSGLHKPIEVWRNPDGGMFTDLSIEAGHKYRYRMMAHNHDAVSDDKKWSYSDNELIEKQGTEWYFYNVLSETVQTRPLDPTSQKAEFYGMSGDKARIRITWRDNGWAGDSYEVRYAESEELLRTDGGYKTSSVDLNYTGGDGEKNAVKSHILEVEAGKQYWLRVVVKNSNPGDMGISAYGMHPNVFAGSKPDAPTLNAIDPFYKIGDEIHVGWTHNATDGSAQTKAEIERIFIGEFFERDTETGEVKSKGKSTNKEIITVDGATSSAFIPTIWQIGEHTMMSVGDNTKFKWRVRTAGAADSWSNWSEYSEATVLAPPKCFVNVMYANPNYQAMHALTSQPDWWPKSSTREARWYFKEVEERPSMLKLLESQPSWWYEDAEHPVSWYYGLVESKPKQKGSEQATPTFSYVLGNGASVYSDKIFQMQSGYAYMTVNITCDGMTLSSLLTYVILTVGVATANCWITVSDENGFYERRYATAYMNMSTSVQLDIPSDVSNLTFTVDTHGGCTLDFNPLWEALRGAYVEIVGYGEEGFDYSGYYEYVDGTGMVPSADLAQKKLVCYWADDGNDAYIATTYDDVVDKGVQLRWQGALTGQYSDLRLRTEENLYATDIDGHRIFEYLQVEYSMNSGSYPAELDQETIEGLISDDIASKLPSVALPDKFVRLAVGSIPASAGGSETGGYSEVDGAYGKITAYSTISEAVWEYGKVYTASDSLTQVPDALVTALGSDPTFTATLFYAPVYYGDDDFDYTIYREYEDGVGMVDADGSDGFTRGLVYTVSEDLHPVPDSIANPTFVSGLFSGGSPDSVEQWLQLEDGGTVTGLPVMVKLTVSGTENQKPIAWGLDLVPTETFTYTGMDGNTTVALEGQPVYSITVDASDGDMFSPTEQYVSIAAEDSVFVSGKTYRFIGNVLTNAGLRSENATEDFTVDFDYDMPDPVIEGIFNMDDYTMQLMYGCYDENGNPVEDVTIDIYRINYDNTLTLLADGLSNAYVKDGRIIEGSLVDQYPSFGTCSYRIVANDANTDQVSYFDTIPIETPVYGILIQWDGQMANWNEDTNEAVFTGEQVFLRWDLKVDEDADPDRELVEYIGRENPVAYFGTQLGVKGSWSSNLVKWEQAEELAQLRKLQRWQGTCYVRETSGAGYRAVVTPSFGRDYDSLKVPVTLEITKVEE